MNFFLFHKHHLRKLLSISNMCTIITYYIRYIRSNLFCYRHREEKFKFFFADISRRSKHGRLVKNNLKIISTKKERELSRGRERDNYGFSMGNIIIIYFLESGLYDYCCCITYDDDCCYYFQDLLTFHYLFSTQVANEVCSGF